MTQKVSFEARLKTLEGIVKELEDGELSLENAVGKYQDGMKLLKDLQEHLARLERQIEILTTNGESRPFAAEATEPENAP